MKINLKKLKTVGEGDRQNGQRTRESEREREREREREDDDDVLKISFYERLHDMVGSGNTICLFTVARVECFGDRPRKIVVVMFVIINILIFIHLVVVVDVVVDDDGERHHHGLMDGRQYVIFNALNSSSHYHVVINKMK